jgi:hypothetical protein
MGDGMRAEGGPLVVANNIVQLNLIRQNGRDGIRANATSGANTFERNVIRESGEHDAHDSPPSTGSSVDGGGGGSVGGGLFDPKGAKLGTYNGVDTVLVEVDGESVGRPTAMVVYQ